jgi:hypothetical protein
MRVRSTGYGVGTLPETVARSPEAARQDTPWRARVEGAGGGVVGAVHPSERSGPSWIW